MVDKNPCINCITYAVCKARIMDCITSTDDYDINNLIEFNEVITTSYFRVLAKKCSLIENHISQLIKLSIDETIKRKEQEDKLYTYQHVTKVISQVMYELFDIEDLINKELKHVR